MVLVIGGAASGKRAFVMRELGYAQEDIAFAELDSRPVAAGVEAIVRRSGAENLLPALLSKEVVICDEISSGVIPLEAEERQWREATGRLCCALAKEADTVVRIFCGIPTVLKGTL